MKDQEAELPQEIEQEFTAMLRAHCILASFRAALRVTAREALERFGDPESSMAVQSALAALRNKAKELVKKRGSGSRTPNRSRRVAWETTEKTVEE